MLPVGVLIPTRGSVQHLPGHLAAMDECAAEVQEILVVDSCSADGTVEFLRAHLRHPGLRILQHPRGLYKSWNYGIRQITAEYTYISTVGDTITLEGLQHLAEMASALRADLVISCPDFRDAEGRPMPSKRWPVHDLLEQWRVHQLERLDRWHVLLLSALDIPAGIIGSSASNLYRTETLKRFPFPTDYGHFGDLAWSIRHAFHTSWVVTPKTFTRFIVNSTGARISGEEMEILVRRLLDLAYHAIREDCEQEHAAAVAERLPNSINVAGRTSLRQTASILKRCRLYIGSDSAGAHMACAAGIPNVVVLGGGHFGRFFPYSPLTSVVCLPLECYGCSWRCTKSRPHCVKDVDPQVVAEAVCQTLAEPSSGPRIFAQPEASWKPQPGEPAWAPFEPLLSPGAGSIVHLSSGPA